jgi:hypothetical protein
MEVLKVKVDFEKPSSGSRHESLTIQTIGQHLGHLKDLEISKYKRFVSFERP